MWINNLEMLLKAELLHPVLTFLTDAVSIFFGIFLTKINTLHCISNFVIKNNLGLAHRMHKGMLQKAFNPICLSTHTESVMDLD